MTTRALLALALAALPLAVPAHAQAPTTGEGVLRAMHDRYAGKWYHTLSFSQKTTRRTPADTFVVQTWREYATIPGALRIEMGPPEANNGALYKGDSVFAVRNGQVVARRAQRNPLMLLGFDVYALPTDRIAQMLREEGFPMSPVRTDTWQGRPVYVVGGGPGDLHSPQFWIDAQRLVFVRSIEPFPGDSTKSMEVHFDDYRPAGPAWVSAAVDISVDGKTFQREEYSDIKTDVALDPALFDPDRWASAPHPQS